MPPPPAPPRARRILFVADLEHPESVLHDREQDVYFISKMQGPSAAKDGRASITRMRPDGRIEARDWVAGGKNEVTLNAPKDGDHRRCALGDRHRRRARFRSAHGSGRADRLFRIGPDRVPSVAIIIASFGGDTIFTWRPGSGNLEVLAVGPGQFDGVEMTPEGRVFITSEATSSPWELRDDRLVEVILNLPGVADLGYDVTRKRLLCRSRRPTRWKCTTFRNAPR